MTSDITCHEYQYLECIQNNLFWHDFHAINQLDLDNIVCNLQTFLHKVVMILKKRAQEKSHSGKVSRTFECFIYQADFSVRTHSEDCD